jgi:hypothetical protein
LHSKTSLSRTHARSAGVLVWTLRFYHALRTKIQTLATQAMRMPIPAGISPTTMKNRILRVALELKVPVTIRKVPDGLIFWRSTDDDLQQASELSSRLQSARHQRPTPSPGRTRRTTRSRT